MNNDVKCRDCGQVIGVVPGHACPGFDHEAMAARLAALEAAPRLALRYVARAVTWAHGDPTTRAITYGAFKSDGEAWEALRVLGKDPPSGFSGVDQCSVEPEIVVIVGNVVQVVTLGEVIKATAETGAGAPAKGEH